MKEKDTITIAFVDPVTKGVTKTQTIKLDGKSAKVKEAKQDPEEKIDTKYLERVKEYYQLAWEYLKRSDNYKKICDQVKDFISFPYYSSGARTEASYLFEAEFNKKVPRISYKQLCYLYNFFGDVYRCDFEDWWNETKDFWVRNNSRWFTNGVREYSPYKEFIGRMENYIENFIANQTFKKKRGEEVTDHEPTLKEFKEYFAKWSEQPFIANNRIDPYFRVNLWPPNYDAFKSESDFINILKKQFEKILKAKYKEISLMRPKGIKRPEELKKYLAVYDRKKTGLKWDAIIKELNIKGDKKDKAIIRREYQRYKAKAERIIQNIERATFPGRY